MYMVVRIVGEEIVYPPAFGEDNKFTDLQLVQIAASNFGGAATDYTVYRAPDKSNRAQKIADGEEYTFEWNAPAGPARTTITGIDFSLEDVKRILRVTRSKARLIADGIDKVVLTFTAYKPDDNGVDDAFNSNQNFPVKTPNGLAYVRVDFINGIAVCEFSTTVFGEWLFPQNIKRYEEFRFKDKSKINALIPIIQL